MSHFALISKKRESCIQTTCRDLAPLLFCPCVPVLNKGEGFVLDCLLSQRFVALMSCSNLSLYLKVLLVQLPLLVTTFSSTQLLGSGGTGDTG